MRHVTATASFASTHRDEAESPYIHGHTFWVAVTELGTDELTRKGLDEDLLQVVIELHLHSLDDMLVGGSQELGGIATWVQERLLMRHPRIVLTEIWVADRPEVRIGIRREIR